VKVTNRRLKSEVNRLLNAADISKAIENICRQYPARRSINAVFSFFYSKDERVKWRAIAAAGRVVARLAEENLESARVIMRRLMWNLNDESGGIGWGSSEAMGEITALSPKLADEFSPILRSYIRPDENFIEYEMLQRGVIWGIGRLAQVRPYTLQETDTHLLPFLESGDSIHRGYAAWALGSLKSQAAVSALERLAEDHNQILLFKDLQLNPVTVCLLAKEALKKITNIS
jgi:HEAT-like repeat protein